MNQWPHLRERLRSALPYVRPGARIADVGTDHAHLPIYLVGNGICSFAVASDVGEGPIARARCEVELYGLTEKIETLLTDGLQGIEPYGVEDVLIFGMGGELITQILEAAPWICRPGIRLILQPMTHAFDVRDWLSAHGFRILHECLTREEFRVYQTLCAEYDGVARSLSAEDRLLGRANRERGGETFCYWLDKLIESYRVRRDGKRKSGTDCSEEETVLQMLEAQLRAATAAEKRGTNE
jgi:tRNA (adenine22-N1)-methyltransferase